MSTRSILLLAICLFTSCGGSDVRVDVFLSVNDSTNSLVQISNDFQIGASAGVFFVFDELKDIPVSIDDVKTGGDTFSDPDLATTAVGMDPLQDEFKINASSLLPTSFYRVMMIAKDNTGAITHTGTSDCPVRLSDGGTNNVKICFGKNIPSNPPLCPGLTVFGNCPGLN